MFVGGRQSVIKIIMISPRCSVHRQLTCLKGNDSRYPNRSLLGPLFNLSLYFRLKCMICSVSVFGWNSDLYLLYKF